MIHREFGFVMPDVELVQGGFRRRKWSYVQAWSGIRMGEAYVVYYDGSCLGQGYHLPEEIWATVYPLDPYRQPMFHRLFGCEAGEHECYGPSIIRTPATWPDDKRWLCSYAGTLRSTIGQAKRQHCGLGWAPNLFGPWRHNHVAIPPRGVIPITGDWPPGMWPTALLVWRDRVILVTRDGSVPQPLVHEVCEIHPDLSATLLGAIELPGEPPQQWCNDAMLAGDGRGLYVLEGGDPGQQGKRKAIVEWYADLTGDAWPALVTMRRSGRVFAHPDPSVYTWDGGYMREPDGSVASPGETAFANAGNGRGPRQIGNWWGQMWTSVPSPILERTPEAVEVIE